MRKHIALILLTGLMLAGCTPKVEKTPESITTRYSVKMLGERLTSFNNKTKRVGFTATECPGWDYVPGLVGKATLDVWDYYKDVPELGEQSQEWFNSVLYYGEHRIDDAKFTEAADLDILNAAKVYCRLYAGAATEEQKAMAKKGMQTAMDGIHKYVHTNQYIISGPYATGGWWHKNKYTNQMWCDGQYMGPALLAQLIEYNTVYPELGLDLYGFTWDDVMLQLDTAWRYLWNEEEQLLWHVFTTDNEHGGAQGWYNQGHAAEIIPGSEVYHSSECWARACGWYIMALTDILESMDKAGYAGAGHDRLVAQLQTLAAGLARRQDVASGCWYQLPQYTNTACATYVDETTTGSARVANNGEQCNYLESSGTCAFVASILKGMRLGHINKSMQVVNAFDPSDVQTMETIAKRGYEGIIANFVSENWEVTFSCESAGLSKDRNGTVAYYLLGYDVAINDDTEGKAFGPFLLAAVEYERAYLR